MEKYKKIGDYIIEASQLDPYTYSIALWHISDSSLDCEMCEVLFAPSYTHAMNIWLSLCIAVAAQASKKKSCLSVELSSAQMKDNSTDNKGFFPLLRSENPND